MTMPFCVLEGIGICVVHGHDNLTTMLCFCRRKSELLLRLLDQKIKVESICYLRDDWLVPYHVYSIPIHL